MEVLTENVVHNLIQASHSPTVESDAISMSSLMTAKISFSNEKEQVLTKKDFKRYNPI